MTLRLLLAASALALLVAPFVAAPAMAKDGKTAPATTLTPPKAPAPGGKGIILTEEGDQI